MLYNPIIEANSNNNTHDIRYASLPYYSNLTNKIIITFRSKNIPIC